MNIMEDDLPPPPVPDRSHRRPLSLVSGSEVTSQAPASPREHLPTSPSMHAASNSQHDSGIDLTFESEETLVKSTRSRKSSQQPPATPTPSQLNAQLYLSADGQSLVSSTKVDLIAARLKEKSLKTYVELHAFSQQQNIAFESVQNIIGARAGKDWPRVIIDVDDQSYLCSDDFADGVKSRISEAVTTAGTSMCDLTGAVGHTVPSPMVFALATEVVSPAQGEIQFAGDHVVYLHSCESCTTRKYYEHARTQQAAELIQQVDEHGFCVVPDPADEHDEDDSLSRAVLWDYQESHPGRSLTHVSATDDESKEKGRKRRLLVEPAILHEELDVLKRAVATRTETMWRQDPSSATYLNIMAALEPSDFPVRPRAKLAAHLMQSDYAEELERASQQHLVDLDRDQHEVFVDLIERQLWCPLHLYAAGIIATQDLLLRQDLESFVTEHFRKELIPRALDSVYALDLRYSPSRKEALDILQEARDGLKTFPQLQEIIVQIGDCLQIDPPTEDLVLDVKHMSLQGTAASMQHLTSAVEILQNLLWVLLATSGPGLFISSVKYTSRMIKRYDAIGDPEITGLLNLWWAKVSEGQHDEEDLRQMKQMGKEAISMWMEEE